MKDSITEALKAENFKLKSRVDSLEEKIIKVDISRNKLDQYTRRNNIEILGIPATVADNHLEDKVLDICKAMNLSVEKSDIKGYHRIGEGNPKAAIIRFAKRTFCNLILDKKNMDLRKLTTQNYFFKIMWCYL